MALESEVPTADGGNPQSAADRGWCLCLSGGGFRATLFHLGVIQRLNELGILAKLSTITSVSGGSILNGFLASRWSNLTLTADGTFGNLSEIIVGPMRQFCSKDLRTRVLFGTRLNPLNWPAIARDRLSVSANFLADACEPLFNARLGDLPAPNASSPRFVFCSTNVGSGACWHFHSGPNARMGDFYFGYLDAAHVRVSEAVAASAAFPPGFSALRLPVPRDAVVSRVDQWGELRAPSAKRLQGGGQDVVRLTDGGVYDNLGVEPVWRMYKTLLVSDAGRPFESTDKTGQGIISRLRRAADISMEQVAAVRKRWLVEQLTNGRRHGAIWTLHSLLNDFPLADKQGYGREACLGVQGIRTDLDAFSEAEMACLENHGYSMADAAVRSWFLPMCRNPTSPFQWPDNTWCEDRKTCEALAQSGQRRIVRDLGRYIVHRGN
jgi:NTE family protein